MVQGAMLLCTIATGVFAKSWRQAAVITTAVFVAVLITQTINVESRADEVIGAGYWLIQAASLGLSARRRPCAGGPARKSKRSCVAGIRPGNDERRGELMNTEASQTSPPAVPEGAGERRRRAGIGRSSTRAITCVLAVVALVAGLAGPASATTGGAQRFTVVFAGPEGQAGRVVATGVVNGLGSNPASVGDQQLIFPTGTLLLSTEFTGGSGGFDPLSCIGRGSSTGTFVVTGGTGLFAHASGSGTFTGTGVTIAGRLAGGGCSETEVNRYSAVMIIGTIALAT